ncbi:MAG TPA: CGNR zinc finger domain-containing protein [Solirubrobacter sp.]|nr:CGNR zinc finger domain-containing protein [Solirubrobacter sp.]
MTPETIRLVGGSLALDFANTVDWAADETPLEATDALVDADALGRWGARAAAGETREGATTHGDAMTHEDAKTHEDATTRGDAATREDAKTHEDATTHGGVEPRRDAAGAPPHEPLRTAIHRTFSALARRDDPPPEALEIIHAAYVDAAQAATLIPGTGLAHTALHHAIAADAVALLSDPKALERLHRCPGRDCGWLFIDTSGRRRWCSMAACGSREKMRRMYARRRATTREP